MGTPSEMTASEDRSAWMILVYLLPMMAMVPVHAYITLEEREVWAMPLLFVAANAYWVLLRLVLQNKMPDQIRHFMFRAAIETAFVGWLVWVVRLELYTHHGEPWLGLPVFNLRFVALSVTGLVDAVVCRDLWRSKATVLLHILHMALIMSPGADDTPKCFSGTNDTCTATSYPWITLSLAVKTLSLVGTAVVSYRYWCKRTLGREKTLVWRELKMQVRTAMRIHIWTVVGLNQWTSLVYFAVASIILPKLVQDNFKSERPVTSEDP